MSGSGSWEFRCVKKLQFIYLFTGATTKTLRLKRKFGYSWTKNQLVKGEK